MDVPVVVPMVVVRCAHVLARIAQERGIATTPREQLAAIYAGVDLGQLPRTRDATERLEARLRDFDSPIGAPRR